MEYKSTKSEILWNIRQVHSMQQSNRINRSYLPMHSPIGLNPQGYCKCQTNFTIRKTTPPSLLVLIESLIERKSPDPHVSSEEATVFSQQLALGATAFFRGHLSIMWREAYNKTHEIGCGKKGIPCRRWLRNLIKELWEFSKSVWTYRNSAVHGRTTEFTDSKEMINLHAEVDAAYTQYSEDPHYIIQSRRFLFSRPKESVKALDRNSLKCWCLLAKEAELTTQQRTEHYKKTTAKYATSLLPKDGATGGTLLQEDIN